MTRAFTTLLFTLLAVSTSFAFVPSASILRKTTKTLSHVKERRSFMCLNGVVETLAHTVVPVDPLSSYSSLLANEGGYSNTSLYFTLALYVLTLPGLFSLVTRSVKVKLTQKSYDLPGPAVQNSKPEKMVAAEIMAYFKALNYKVSAAEEVITFTGVMGRSNSQAYFLTFCTFMGLGSLGLVLSILLPDIGSYAYALVLLSPYAGFYYWNNAQREDEVKIRMETSDDEATIGITAQGGKEDLERFSKTLDLRERGMVYVQGIFENEEEKLEEIKQEIVANSPPGERTPPY